jgi:plasmid replication initiation protein
MLKFFRPLLKKLVEMLEKLATPTTPLEEENAVIAEVLPPEGKKKQEKPLPKKKTEIIPYSDNPIRDVIDLMEFPFLALSKDRINPIVYESTDKTQKVIISGHRGHFLASIYDWDIILVVAGKIQEILNKSEIPSHTITIPRHELLKALHKQAGKKQQKDLEKSLARLKLTGIETTVNNKDFRHKAGFGFIDRWGYKERKNDRETMNIQITLSPWLYELCCAQGSLLKSSISYFEMTSGLKKFLYRTARKHAGNNRDGWEFSIKKLYEKSGSESDFRNFKIKLKAAVLDDDIPEYSLKWIDKNKKSFVLFRNNNQIKTIEEICEEFENEEKK